MLHTLLPARLTRALALLTVAGLALAACGGSSDETSSASTIAVSPAVVVTSVKGDSESQLFAAIYAQVLQDAGYRVSRKDPVELDRAGVLAALQAGEFQLVPDSTLELLEFVYAQPDAPVAPTTAAPPAPGTTQAPITVPPVDTGAASTTVAATTTTTGTTTTAVVISNGRSTPEQLVAIRAALPDGTGVGNPTLGEQQPIIACTDATVAANEGTQFISLTNLASVAPTIRLAGSPEWMRDNEFGLPALEQYYGGEYEEVVTVDDADLAAAIDDDRADCFAMDSMNPLITTERLTILVDDKAMVRGNAWVPLLAESVASADLIAALDTVNVALTSERINQMLNEITTNGTAPATVANAFLDSL